MDQDRPKRCFILRRAIVPAVLLFAVVDPGAIGQEAKDIPALINALQDKSSPNTPKPVAPGKVTKTGDSITLVKEQMTFRRVSPKAFGRDLPDFLLLETEVTNAMYELYLRDTGRTKDDQGLWAREQARWETMVRSGTITFSTTDAGYDIKNEALLWEGNKPPKDNGDFPVGLVSVIEAAAFCEWLTKRYPALGTFRFPTVEEWKLTAYGAKRKYPWGDQWDTSRLCCSKAEGQERRSPELVKSRAKGRTPEGIYGMWGNVSEYVIHPRDVHNVTFMCAGARWMGGSFKDWKGYYFEPQQDYWGYAHSSRGKSEAKGFRVLLDVTDIKHKFEHKVPYDTERSEGDS